MSSTLSGGNKIVTDGLVLYLDAANTRSFLSGATAWNDLTPNRNVGVLTNGPSFSSSNYGSIAFDGVNDYIITLSDVSQVYASSSFTISAWVNVSNGGSSVKGIFGCFDDNGVNNWNGYSFWVNGGESRFSFLIGYGTGYYFIPANQNYQTETWYNLVGVNENGFNYFFINGVLQASVNSVVNIHTKPVKIGRGYTDTNDYYFSGKVSTGLIYNKALTSSEILQNYNALKSRFGL